MADATVAPSMVDVPASEDHKTEGVGLANQQLGLDGDQDPNSGLEHEFATVDNITATENGIGDASAEGNGAVAEAPAPDVTTEPQSAQPESKEDMPKKPATGPVKRLTKAVSSAKPGNTTATKTGTVAASVKKILNSGAFTTKSSTSIASSAKMPSTPAAKKTSSSTLTASTATKPPTAGSKHSTTTTSTSTATAVWRASMAPSAAKPLSSSTSSRPPSATATKAASTADTTRTPITSPTGSVALLRASTGSGASRPRASVSEGVPTKKPRSSISGYKPPSSSETRPLKPAGSASISSIREVKEDSKAVQELEAKYAEAASALESNIKKVENLEAQVETTKGTLASAEAERDEKHQALVALQASKEALELELKTAQQGLEGQREEQRLGEVQLVHIREELKTAQESAATQIGLVTNLKEQLKTVERELASAKEEIATSRSSYDSLAETAKVEKVALIKARVDLEAIQVESEALAETHAKAYSDATERIKVLQGEIEKATRFSVELSQLKEEKAEIEAKLSEAEVEVLELREASEQAGDDREKLLARLKKLEQDMVAVVETNTAVNKALSAKEEEHNAISENLKQFEEQLQNSLESHKKVLEDLQEQEVVHAQKLAEVHRVHEEHNQATAEKIKRLTEELELQESNYNGKLENIKAEHASLLEQAFQKAKNEAGTEHSQELQNLRAQSHVTIEQLRQAHQASLDDTKSSYEEAIEMQVKSRDKQISSLSLELKATQDDLAKAKAGLEAALALEVTLKSQLEQKDAESAAAHVPVDQSEEVARLTKELANAKDDLANSTEAFDASKETFLQISVNHQTELEEAAKGRAEEVTKLRNSFEVEASAYQEERSELVSRISELEVELATVKAGVGAQPAAMPLSPRKEANGAAAGSPAVTKEELQHMHEAHNLKVYELEASHEQIVKQLQEKLDLATQKVEEQHAQAERLQMELHFAEQTAEENEDEMKQLRDEIEHLKTQLRSNGDAGP